MAASQLALRDLALIVGVVAVWGISFVAIKFGLREIPPFALASLRFFLAALPLVFFVHRPRIPWRLIVGYGLAIGVFQFGLLFLGMALGMPAGLSSVVIQLQVFFTIALAAASLGDRFSPEDLLGAAVATVGVAVLGMHRLAEGASSTLVGFALVIGAALAWGIGNVIATRAAARYDGDLFALVVWAALVAAVPLALLSLLVEGGLEVVTAVATAGALTWSCVLLLAWGSTLFAFASWARLLHRYPTATIAPFGLLVPVFGLAGGALFLDEALAPLQWTGVALVLLGLAENVFGAQLRAWLRRA